MKTRTGRHSPTIIMIGFRSSQSCRKVNSIYLLPAEQAFFSGMIVSPLPMMLFLTRPGMRNVCIRVRLGHVFRRKPQNPSASEKKCCLGTGNMVLYAYSMYKKSHVWHESFSSGLLLTGGPRKDRESQPLVSPHSDTSERER